jgi:hypothetical protein
MKIILERKVPYGLNKLEVLINGNRTLGRIAPYRLSDLSTTIVGAEENGTWGAGGGIFCNSPINYFIYKTEKKRINFYDKGINYKKDSLSSIRDKIVHRVQYVKQWVDSVDSKIAELEEDHLEFDTNDQDLRISRGGSGASVEENKKKSIYFPNSVV